MTKFITNQNVEIKLELASIGDRILAFIVDALIIGAYLTTIMWLLSSLGGSDDFGVVLVVFSLPAMFYSLLFEVFFNGQSPGKRVREIKVVKLDGGAPSVGSYLLRWLLRPIDIFFYGAVAMLSIIITRNGQRLGDLAAGTTVIKLRTSTHVRDFQALETAEDRQITFPQVRRLSDPQIDLIQRSLKMRRAGFSDKAASELAVKIKNVLEIQSDMPDVKFLYTIIGDYQQLIEQSAPK